MGRLSSIIERGNFDLTTDQVCAKRQATHTNLPQLFDRNVTHDWLTDLHIEETSIGDESHSLDWQTTFVIVLYDGLSRNHHNDSEARTLWYDR
jgi:hypothetical protein